MEHRAFACRVVFLTIMAGMFTPSLACPDERFVAFRYTHNGRDYAARVSRTGQGRIGRYSVASIYTLGRRERRWFDLPREQRQFAEIAVRAVMECARGEPVGDRLTEAEFDELHS